LVRKGEKDMSLQSTDPIADLLTRIRNAVMVGKNEIRVPSSKIKKVVAEQLKANNYIADVKVEAGKPRDTLIVTINKPGENSVISEIKRLSKPGRRVYVGVDEIPRVKSGRGLVLISTSKGVITGQEAVKQRLGGELLLSVY
jgi:small subunit ribosomal protein S8